VKAEAALVVAGGAFLLGVGEQKRGVDVEDQLLGSGAGVPCLCQRHRAGGADRFEQAGVDRLQHPVGRRLRRHRSEQRLLVAQHAQVGEVIAAIGDRDREVAQDDTGVVGGAALPARRHCLRERRRQRQPIGQLDQEEGASVGDQALGVRPDFYGLVRRLCLHLPGVLLVLGMGRRKPHSQDPRGRSRMASSGAYRWTRASWTELRSGSPRRRSRAPRRPIPAAPP
jgi:hypothetical protein